MNHLKMKNQRLTFDQAWTELLPKINSKGLSMEIVYNTRYQLAEKHVGIVVFEKYYYRVQNYVTLTVILLEDDDELVCEAISSGAASGLLKITWGADTSMLNCARDSLLDIGFHN